MILFIKPMIIPGIYPPSAAVIMVPMLSRYSGKFNMRASLEKTMFTMNPQAHNSMAINSLLRFSFFNEAIFTSLSCFYWLYYRCDYSTIPMTVILERSNIWKSHYWRELGYFTQLHRQVIDGKKTFTLFFACDAP